MIELEEATTIARECMRFMLGNLSFHTWMIEYAKLDTPIMSDYWIIGCSIKVPYEKERILYEFTINKEGRIIKMELKKATAE